MIPRRRRVLATGLAGLALTLAAPGAGAQPEPNKRFAAQTLFEEAKTLAEANKWEEVCPKLEASEELDPHMVTLYRLADCYEHIGRTASAWGMFLQAAAQARAAHEEARARVAESRATALEPKLSRLVIVVTPTPGLEVSRGDTPIEPSLWGLKTPVDPGLQTIHAAAPGKKAFTTTVRVPADAAVVTVTVPSLENEEPLQYWPADAYPGAERAPRPTRVEDPWPEPPSRTSSTKTAGGITFLVGLGAMGGAGILMAADNSSNGCSFTKCALPLVLLFSGAVASTVGAVVWLAGNSQGSTGVSLGPGSFGLRRTF